MSKFGWDIDTLRPNLTQRNAMVTEFTKEGLQPYHGFWEYKDAYDSTVDFERLSVQNCKRINSLGEVRDRLLEARQLIRKPLWSFSNKLRPIKAVKKQEEQRGFSHVRAASRGFHIGGCRR